MRLIDCLTDSSKERFQAKAGRLQAEIEILKQQIDYLLREENDNGLVYTSIYESAVIRTAKLTRNSGFTILGVVELARRNTIREFRSLVYPVLNSLEKLELSSHQDLEKTKNCRDRLIVHIDPRFAFDKEKTNRNKVSIPLLKRVLEFILELEKILFETDII